MTSTESHPDTILNNHIELCDRSYQILQEENAHLKRTETLPPAELLEQKKVLLDELDKSNDSLKQINESNVFLSEAQKDMAKAAQNKIMKVLLLDRENEQLILKTNVSTPAQRLPNRPSPQNVKNLYNT